MINDLLQSAKHYKVMDVFHELVVFRCRHPCEFHVWRLEMCRLSDLSWSDRLRLGVAAGRELILSLIFEGSPVLQAACHADHGDTPSRFTSCRNICLHLIARNRQQCRTLNHSQRDSLWPHETWAWHPGGYTWPHVPSLTSIMPHYATTTCGAHAPLLHNHHFWHQ